MLANFLGPRLNTTMPALTRRGSADRPDCWHIYYGDVHAGTIAMRTGIPHDEDPWGWSCGFYPGCHPGECTNGTAASFAEARADFASAWKIFLSNRTEADFPAWRHQRDSTAWKYGMWGARLKLPTQLPSGRSKCFCGADLTISGVTDHVRSAHVRMEVT